MIGGLYIINYCTGFYVSNGHGGCNMFIYNIISHNFRFLYNVLHLSCLHVFIIKFIHKFQQNESQSHFLKKMAPRGMKLSQARSYHYAKKPGHAHFSQDIFFTLFFLTRYVVFFFFVFFFVFF